MIISIKYEMKYGEGHMVIRAWANIRLENGIPLTSRFCLVQVPPSALNGLTLTAAITQKFWDGLTVLANSGCDYLGLQKCKK